ncbi:uncharacterized protein LOC126894115 isoform X2 [Daktulosphaira vitifoliae]|uniref:uncharacterized protein LOC126894115 isoform X2 n=1 Tax=Daktulosphaira vitifoliae TaxID=58002 RepID=UPI0021A9CBA1|nr:uncharacterized protein LOC126894115 isoform X2 [Daktulosphaira vitifoliae]
MHFISFLCLASYLKCLTPIVLSSSVISSFNSLRFSRSTQMKDVKVIPDDVENFNQIQLSNKSHIILLADNSSIINKNVELKEHYEIQNITDEITKLNDTFANITSMPELSNYMTTQIVLISGASIAGCVVILSFVILGYLTYKRSRWNSPQALDHCSNADSIGYLDDMFKENSDEMYSLDNDSFLNSLEAMTIQNYWTENIKHTKL